MIGDTIAAVSTPYGKGGVALLRVSGPEALHICEKVFVPMNGEALLSVTPRMAIYGRIYSGEGEEIDQGLATFFRAPASFTGEDTVEITCHGGILLTETVLTALFAAGARPAEAGEFTRRAFLNGKLGLSSAEALGNMLEAETHEQLKLAHSGMQGRVEERTEALYREIARVLASIYVKIDYPDEDLADMSVEEIVEALSNCRRELARLVATYRTGHAVAEGIKTVICGRPNVGKSSLYNCILGRDAAIVTAYEGTTRDVLSDRASLGRVTLRLFDTAGLHEANDPVEQIGVARAKSAVQEAELLLCVFDGSQSLCEEDEQVIALAKEHSGAKLAVLNKCDLPALAERAPLEAVFDTVLALSVETGAGMEALSETVERLFTDGALDLGRDAVLCNARQHAAALSALQALDGALDALRAGMPQDLSLADAERAMAALSELDGRAVSEEIVSQIFSHFCVGK